MEIDFPAINLQIRQIPVEMPQTKEKKKEVLEEPEWQIETESEDDDIEAFAPEISEELSRNLSMTPIESFQLFFTYELFQEITNKTNHYADAKDKVKKVKNQCSSKRKKDRDHVLNIDVAELKTFVATTMFMTIMKKPKLSLYWTTSKMFATPFLKKWCLVIDFSQFWGISALVTKNHL